MRLEHQAAYAPTGYYATERQKSDGTARRSKLERVCTKPLRILRRELFLMYIRYISKFLMNHHPFGVNNFTVMGGSYSSRVYTFFLLFGPEEGSIGGAFAV